MLDSEVLPVHCPSVVLSIVVELVTLIPVIVPDTNNTEFTDRSDGKTTLTLHPELI